MQRPRAKTVAAAGVNAVRSLVEAANSIFQRVDQDNDVGNDAYIEFVEDERCTGCCIAAQIKSGRSYLSADGTHFHLRADAAHFRYWASHSLPVCGFVHDPESGVTVWCDITRYLSLKPEVIESGPFSIPIPRGEEFSAVTFAAFKAHFLGYRAIYGTHARLGEALARFADVEDHVACADALRSLLSFHRQQYASWHYVWSNLPVFRGHRLLYAMIAELAHIPGHGDIFWSARNQVAKSVAQRVMRLIGQHAGRDHVLALLEVVDENGFSRGSIGQCSWALISAIQQRIPLLRSIVDDSKLPEPLRHAGLWLLVYELQQQSPEVALSLLAEVKGSFTSTYVMEIVAGLEESVGRGERIDLG